MSTAIRYDAETTERSRGGLGCDDGALAPSHNIRWLGREMMLRAVVMGLMLGGVAAVPRQLQAGGRPDTCNDDASFQAWLSLVNAACAPDAHCSICVVFWPSRRHAALSSCPCGRDQGFLVSLPERG